MFRVGESSSVTEDFQNLFAQASTLKAAIDEFPLSVTSNISVLEAVNLMAQGADHCALINQTSSSNSASSTVNPSSYALVIDNGELTGLITERDIVRLTAQKIDITAISVAHVMAQPVITLDESHFQDPLAALALFRQHHIRHLPIVNAYKQVVGVVTPYTIRRALQPSDLFRLRRVEEMMSTNVIHAPLETTVLSLAQLMMEHRVSCVVITQLAYAPSSSSTVLPLGIVTEHDITQFQRLALNLSTLPAQTIMSTPLTCLSPEDDLWQAHNTMEQLRVRRLVITDAHGVLAGIITQTSILNALNPVELQKTIATLQQQVEQLQHERIQWFQTRTSQLESQIHITEQRYATLTQSAPVGIFQADVEGNYLYVNDRWCEITGMSLEEAQGKGWIRQLHPDDRETVAERWYRAVHTQSSFQLEYRFETPTGEVTWVFGQAVAEVEVEECIISYIGTITDITGQKQAEHELHQLNQELEARVQQRTAELEASRELAQVTLHSIADAVITTDAHGQVEYFNPVAERLTGWSATAAHGRLLTDVFQILNETTREPVKNPIENVLREGCVARLANHTLLISQSGVEYSIETSAAPIRDRQKQIIGAVIVFHDVTQSRQLARQLSWQASHDVLTGLNNRRQFEHELTEILQDVQQGEPSHILCFLDLDQFKVINDTCGHLAGDELLRQISQLLQHQIRTTDLLARLGGDEFGIVLKHCSLEQAESIANKMCSAVQSFRFFWQCTAFNIGLSIGLVSLQDTSTMTEAMSNADAACYAAKNRGRNRIHIYQIDDAELVQQRGEQQWSVRIKQALEADRFCLYRQAIVQTAAHASHPMHYEVLLRMVDEQGNLILPGMFIPAAERYGLMPDIDRWVVQTFFSYTALSKSQPLLADLTSDTLHLINLSGTSIGDSLFLQFLKEQLVRYEIDPQTIGFEITETTAISNLERATHFIHELKQLGCSFALDDFGSGMSSFDYLRTLPIDYLKIDGKFIKDIVRDPTAHVIVESINRVGHVMGLQTIAESVESLAVQEQLKAIQVDYLQGYGIAHPCPMIPT